MAQSRWYLPLKLVHIAKGLASCGSQTADSMPIFRKNANYQNLVKVASPASTVGTVTWKQRAYGEAVQTWAVHGLARVAVIGCLHLAQNGSKSLISSSKVGSYCKRFGQLWVSNCRQHAHFQKKCKLPKPMPLKDPLAVSTQEPCDRCNGWQVKLPAPMFSLDGKHCHRH